MGFLDFLKRAAPEKKFDDVGNVEPVCPYCSKVLESKPARKKACPHCGKSFLVRTRPSDKEKVLVTEAQAEIIREQWSIVNGTHEDYLQKKADSERVREDLTERFGCKPPENDVKWVLLSEQQLDQVKKGNWGLYRCTLFDMAELLRGESRLKQALGTYLEVFYIDLNGPINLEGSREFPPFSPERSIVAPGVVNRIHQIIKKLELSDPEVEALLKERIDMTRGFVKPAMPVDTAIERLREAFAEKARVIESVKAAKKKTD